MNINKENKQHIHDALITNMQLRLNLHYENVGFIDGKPYEDVLESLVDSILHTNTIADINDVVIKYDDLFCNKAAVGAIDDEDIFTLDGTMSYVLNLALDFLVVDDSIRKLLNNISPTPRNL